MAEGPVKAPLDSIVKYQHGYAVVVDYKTDGWRYRIIRTDPQGRNPYGMPLWVGSTAIYNTGRKSKRPGIIYRKNQKLGNRGCGCECCPHVKGFADEPD